MFKETVSIPFETWAIVELMGHSHFAGKVSEANLFGTVLLRLDVPAVEHNPAFTKYFSASSIYAITPTDEATVLRYVERYQPKPISIYIPQTAQAPQLEKVSGGSPGYEETSYIDYSESEYDDDEEPDPDYEAFENEWDDGDYDFSDDIALDTLESAFPTVESVGKNFQALREMLSSADEIAPDSTDAEHPHGMMELPTEEAAQTQEEIPLALYENEKSEGDSVILPVVPLEKLEIVHVIRIERKASKGSNSPSWEMDTIEGKRFWVFKHENPERNTWVYFRDAGYQDYLLSMEFADVDRWQKNPIEVTIFKEGEFYRPVLVAQRPEEAKPDNLKNFWPERRIEVVNKARELKGIIIDVETTGTSTSDEITEIAMLNLETGETWETLIFPSDIKMIDVPGASGKSPSAINGITAGMLSSAPRIKDIAETIYLWTENRVLIGHQIEFDVRLINQSLLKAGLDEIKPKETVCTMHDLMDKFVGDPFGDGSRFRWQSLQDSAAYLGVTPSMTHRAMPDVQTTKKVIQALATLEPAASPEADYINKSKDIPF
jgi:DNA polymerase III epsilon subunit-like protein